MFQVVQRPFSKEPESPISTDPVNQEILRQLKQKFTNTIVKVISEDDLKDVIYEKIEILFNRISIKAADYKSFNYLYWHKLLTEYEEFCNYVNREQHTATILAVFLQRMSGRMGSVEASGKQARDFLKDNLLVFDNCANQVKDLIVSLKIMSPSKTLFFETMYEDLNLTRLGDTYENFLAFHARIDADRNFLDRIDHFKIKLCLANKLLERPNIYTTNYWGTRYEKQARGNLTSYVNILKDRISQLDEEIKAKKHLESFKT